MFCGSTINLLRKTDFLSRKFPMLRLLTQAGGALAPSLQYEIMDAFLDKKLFVMYGGTEAAPRLTYLKPELTRGKMGSIGSSISGVDVIIID